MFTKAFFYVLVLATLTSWAVVIPASSRNRRDSDDLDSLSLGDWTVEGQSPTGTSVAPSTTQQIPANSTAAASPAAPNPLSTIDTSKYFALIRDDKQYLSSKGDTVAVVEHDDFTALQGSNDKTVRHRFPDGLPGKVVSEAHNDHAIGEDGKKWNTNQSTNKGSLAQAQLSADGKGITIGLGGSFIGQNGEVSTTSFTWTVKEITAVGL